MAAATLSSLRDRLAPPRSGGGPAERGLPEARRSLDLARDLFAAAGAALVLARPDGLVAAAASGAARADEAVAAACRLFEALADAVPPPGDRPAGVLEEIAPARGFTAATPILSPAGRCLGAVCLLDPSRRTLLTGMQRRLFAEFGALLLPALDAATAPEVSGQAGARLQALAEAEPEAFAIFDADGRCILRNAPFGALVGEGAPEADRPGPDVPAGGEEAWIALRLLREAAPAGVTRAARPDGTWLCVEERRGPHGHSLIARVEARDAFGSDGELASLFERCPAPMFVYDRDTSAVLAANDAALALYGWERDAFLRLGLDGIGPVDPDAPDWIHRARDGRALRVAGHAVGLAWQGRPAVLVTVTGDERHPMPAGRAA